MDVNRIEFVKTQNCKMCHKKEQTYFSNLYWLNCSRWYISRSCYVLRCSVKCFICPYASHSLGSSVFIHHSHWCVYFQMLYSTVDVSMVTQPNMKLQIRYLEKDNWAHLSKRWGPINFSYKVLYVQRLLA